MLIRIKTKYLLLSVIILAGLVVLLIVLNHILIKKPPVQLSKNSVSAQINPRPTTAIGNTKEYNHIRDIADTQGLEAAWQYLITTYGKNQVQQFNAHDYAHYVGQLIFERKGLSGISLCTAEFAFGCYHGLLDYAFRKDLSSLPKAENACQQVGNRGTGPYASCIHGIGHGIASYFRDIDLKGALKACDSLPEGAPQYCYDGVFMEFSRDALDTFYRPHDPLYPCDSVDAKYTYACGRNQPAVLMGRMHMTFKDAAAACQKATDQNLQISCYTALGFQAVYAPGNQLKNIIASCRTLNDTNFQYQCIPAAAGELVFQDMSNWQTNAPALCASLGDTSQAEMCREHVIQIQKDYNR